MRAVEGRELLLVEPPSEEVLERVANRCAAGVYWPDPLGFVAARVDVPINIRWNEKSERFQLYDGVGDEADEISCRFEGELPD